jgi:Macrocin-O-methyltransferase (TylF).
LFGVSAATNTRKALGAAGAASIASAPSPNSEQLIADRQQQREIEQARELVNRSEWDAAFAVLNALKAQHVRVQDIDYLRALCFVARNESPSAFEALKEELRYFPENQQAGKMLADLMPQNTAESQVEDAEFLYILEVIRPYTMVGESRLLSLFRLAKRVCVEDLPGNFVECGVAAGGPSTLLAAVIARQSKRPRKLFLSTLSKVCLRLPLSTAPLVRLFRLAGTWSRLERHFPRIFPYPLDRKPSPGSFRGCYSYILIGATRSFERARRGELLQEVAAIQVHFSSEETKMRVRNRSAPEDHIANRISFIPMISVRAQSYLMG